MMYLPLAEATVIAFLAPAIAGYICYLFLGYPYTVKERIATFIALAGVILIARPTSLFGSHASPPPAAAAPNNSTTTTTTTTGDTPHLLPGQEPTPAQRLTAIGIALVGVATFPCGAPSSARQHYYSRHC
jgi:drug/metabolite transporter (DMT)-like permease